MFLWLIANLMILYARTPEEARLRINIAFAISACIPTTFQLLRISIKLTQSGWTQIIKKCWLFIIVNIIISSSCFLPDFTQSVSFSSVAQSLGEALPSATPEYGPPYVVFNIYFLSSIVLLAVNLHKDKRQLAGTQRVELEFLGFACFAGLVVGLSCGTVFALLIKSSALVPVAHAISVLTLVLIVSYGISVHKILAVAVILRRITSYTLLTSYLTVLYLITWFSITYAFKQLMITTELPAHIISTFVVVFSMPPARKRMEQAADWLISIQTSDIPSAVKAAGEIFQSVTTYSALLSQFSEMLAKSFYTEDIVILTIDNDQLNIAYTSNENFPLQQIELASPLPTLIEKFRTPAYRDNLIRLRSTKLLESAIQQFDEFGMSIAVGIFSKSKLQGLVLLGTRTNGRIYDGMEQDALQILCNQFAVALENAQLYTEVQDSKIRNEIMLDQLVSGVIVANPERKISLFNHEAQRITGIQEYVAIGKDISDLPKPICLALETTLKKKTGDRNVEARLFEQDETRKSLTIRLGTTYLLGHDQKPMGALLVFTDMTELKTLEEQVRRSDQLSSVGTLAAGMAHEIKNPLVTIKTFTQLLPKRYSDNDFREEFSSLVAHEVSRIDGIVNELLSFSKPTKPHLIPIHLHDVIGQILKLTREQMVQKDIAVTDNRHAAHDRIMGDAKLLSQALINLTLNAVEAIGKEGSITIGTANCQYRFANGEGPDQSVIKECIRLQISDSGQGIAADHIKKIFDPFFTRKSEGTGMGLSVAHGIIQEHHAVIDVESEIGKGSTFHIYIPVIEEEVT
jgi:two-component system nitrogen regulation sensor histidine kinase GlnL